jgi:hypothetical protein
MVHCNVIYYEYSHKHVFIIKVYKLGKIFLH